MNDAHIYTHLNHLARLRSRATAVQYIMAGTFAAIIAATLVAGLLGVS
jgi:hypothetical protein